MKKIIFLCLLNPSFAYADINSQVSKIQDEAMKSIQKFASELSAMPRKGIIVQYGSVHNYVLVSMLQAYCSENKDIQYIDLGL